MKIKSLLCYELKCDKETNFKQIIKEIRIGKGYIDEILNKYDRDAIHYALSGYYKELKDFKKWAERKINKGEFISYLEYSDRIISLTNFDILLERDQYLIDALKSDLEKCKK